MTLAGDVVSWPGSRLDGPSVLTRLLDENAGHLSICPASSCVSRRAYLDGTLALQTDHHTRAGTLRVTDALAFAPLLAEIAGEASRRPEEVSPPDDGTRRAKEVSR